MATNYWRDTSGDHKWSTDTNWSLGHTPTASEPVAFDASSPDPSILDIDVNTPTINGIDFSGAPGAVTWRNSQGVYDVYITGSLVLKSNIVMEIWSDIMFMSNGGSITSNGASFSSDSWLYLYGNATWTLTDDLTLGEAGNFYVGDGSADVTTFTDNGHNITAYNFIAASNTVINKSGTWTLTDYGNVWDPSLSAEGTWNETGGALIFTGTNRPSIDLNGKTFLSVSYLPSIVDGLFVIQSSGTINYLATNNSATGYNEISITGTLTIVTLAINGYNADYCTLISSPSQPAYISKASGTVELRNVAIIEIEATGGATFNAYGYDCGGNAGWNFYPVISSSAPSTKLELLFNGTPGSTTFVDSSPFNRTVVLKDPINDVDTKLAADVDAEGGSCLYVAGTSFGLKTDNVMNFGGSDFSISFKVKIDTSTFIGVEVADSVATGMAHYIQLYRFDGISYGYPEDGVMLETYFTNRYSYYNTEYSRYYSYSYHELSPYDIYKPTGGWDEIIIHRTSGVFGIKINGVDKELTIYNPLNSVQAGVQHVYHTYLIGDSDPDVLYDELRIIKQEYVSGGWKINSIVNPPFVNNIDVTNIINVNSIEST